MPGPRNILRFWTLMNLSPSVPGQSTSPMAGMTSLSSVLRACPFTKVISFQSQNMNPGSSRSARTITPFIRSWCIKQWICCWSGKIFHRLPPSASPQWESNHLMRNSTTIWYIPCTRTGIPARPLKNTTIPWIYSTMNSPSPRRTILRIYIKYNFLYQSHVLIILFAY